MHRLLLGVLVSSLYSLLTLSCKSLYHIGLSPTELTGLEVPEH